MDLGVSVRVMMDRMYRTYTYLWFGSVRDDDTEDELSDTESTEESERRALHRKKPCERVTKTNVCEIRTTWKP